MIETMRININEYTYMRLFNEVSRFQNRNRSCIMWMNRRTFDKMRKLYPSILFYYIKEFREYYGYFSHMNECYAIMLLNTTVDDDIVVLKRSHLVGRISIENGIRKIDSDIISMSEELSMKSI